MKLNFDSKNPYVTLRRNLKRILQNDKIYTLEKIDLMNELYNKLDFINNFNKYLYTNTGMNNKYWGEYTNKRQVKAMSSLPRHNNPWYLFFLEIEGILNNTTSNDMDKIIDLEKSLSWLDSRPYKEAWLR